MSVAAEERPVPEWLTELAPVLEAIQFAPDVVRVGSHEIRATDPEPWPLPEWFVGTPPLCHRLAGVLYNLAYAHRWGTRLPTGQAQPDLIGILQTANQSSVRVSPGWRTEQFADPGMSRVVRLSDVQLVPAARTQGQTSGITLTTEMGSSVAQPGFYWVYGDVGGRNRIDGLLLRFYFDVKAEGAADLTRELSRAMNAAALPFVYKALTSSASYTRRDSAVLMVPRSTASLAAQVVADVLAVVGHHLNDDRPLFTAPFAPGVGVAEDPGLALSFGMTRCHHVATGVWNAAAEGRFDVQARAEAVWAALAQAGIDPEHPHARASAPIALPCPPPRPALPVLEGDTADLVQAAWRIARELVASAVWVGEQATWVADTMHPVGTDWRPVGVPVGPELYAGTIGIALFLAEVHARVPDPDVLRTARGAVSHALAQAGRIPEAQRPSLYAGWVGIAWALDRLALLLDEPRWTAQATALATAGATTVHELDIISGAAGTILGLVALASRRSDDDLLTLARVHGDHLLAEAARHPDGSLSWDTMSAMPVAAHLCGYSHGAAGIGVALAELGRATGDARYTQAATAAFRYERRHYAPHLGNWPDLRGTEPSGTGFTLAWCHGAPGGALARLRAVALLGEPALESEARAAVAATAGGLRPTLTLDVSPCHGQAGLGETLVVAAGALGEPRWRDAALVHARAVIAERAASDHPWTCGVADGDPVPGLVLGLAGIGWYLLRLHDGSLPCVLSIVPED